MKPTVRQLIDLWGLEPMGTENVLFTQNYLSEETLNCGHPKYTGIVALLTDSPDSYSDMHKLSNDEMWHFYLGDALEILLLYPDGEDELVLMGQDVLNGEKLQFVVPAGVWMGARVRPGGEYSVFGNTMAPGFLQSDFQAGQADALSKQWPQQESLIRSLSQE